MWAEVSSRSVHAARRPPLRLSRQAVPTARPPAASQTLQRSCACGGYCPRCRSAAAHGREAGAFEDGPAGAEPVSPVPPVEAPAPQPMAPSPAATACPTIASIVTTVAKASAVSDACKGSCRLQAGCCSTERGKCGSSAGSGAVTKAVVDIPDACTGELGFMQDLLSTDRRRDKTTEAGSVKECVSAAEARRDGGVPWKGCKIEVKAAGRYELVSDDCPNIGLSADMTSASASDSFRTYLIWRPTGASKWKAVANVGWTWVAATSRLNSGADCAAAWSKPTDSSAGGTGGASSDQPTGTGSAQDLAWGACPAEKPKPKGKPKSAGDVGGGQ